MNSTEFMLEVVRPRTKGRLKVCALNRAFVDLP